MLTQVAVRNDITRDPLRRRPPLLTLYCFSYLTRCWVSTQLLSKARFHLRAEHAPFELFDRLSFPGPVTRLKILTTLKIGCDGPSGSL